LRLADTIHGAADERKITLEDVQVLKMDKEDLNFTRSGIGFKR
jgi:hypothetical protein